jgi:hypothetical protein
VAFALTNTSLDCRSLYFLRIAFNSNAVQVFATEY